MTSFFNNANNTQNPQGNHFGNSQNARKQPQAGEVNYFNNNGSGSNSGALAEISDITSQVDSVLNATRTYNAQQGQRSNNSPLAELQPMFNSVNQAIREANQTAAEIKRKQQAGQVTTSDPLAEVRPTLNSAGQAIHEAQQTIAQLEKMQKAKERASRCVAIMKDAMDGWGTDEDAIFETLEKLTPEERAMLEVAYSEQTGESLRERLRGELSGSDEDKAFKLLNEGAHLDSRVAGQALAEAMKGWGTDENTVNTIFNNATPAQLRDIESTFDQALGEPGALRDWIKGDFSGSAESRLLNKLNQAAMARD